MIQKRKNKVIVVLGMHRSGTSVITRSLELLGVGLGDNLHPAGFDNPKGFWEDIDILNINEKLLAHYKSSYDRLGLAQDFSTGDPTVDELKQHAQNIIAKKLLENHGLWGFKDPRTCRLLSFWQDVFNIVKCEVNYIIALRNPISVALSLATRNNIPFEKSYLLWQQHLLPAISQTAGFHRLVVDYDQLMDFPLEQVARIASAFNLTMPNSNSEIVVQFVDDFLDMNLRHTNFATHNLESNECIPKDITTLYKFLLSSTSNAEALDLTAHDNPINELISRLEAYAPVFAYANDLEDKCISLSQTVTARETQITDLNHSLAELNREISAYQTQADIFVQNTCTLQENLAAAQAEIVHKNEQIAKFKNQAEEFTRNIHTLQENLVAAHAEIVNKDNELAKYKNQAEEFTKNVCTLQENLVAAHAEIVSKDNKLVKYKNQVEEFTRNLFSLQENIADAQTEIVHKDEQIAKYNNKNKEFAQIICTLQEKDIATQIEIAMLASNLYRTQIQQELDLSDWKFLAKHMALIIRKTLQLQPTNKRS